MDPDGNLKESLRLASHIIWAVDNERWIESDETDAARLAELVISLHEWIASGGFLPARWRTV
jgi:hypothetical protein